jgi:hypothetical protein
MREQAPVNREDDANGNPKCCIGQPGGICRHHTIALEWEVTDQPIFPKLKQPGWRNDIKTGDANRAPEHETREAALQRMAEATRRKLRLAAAICGQPTGHNRNKHKAA